MGLFSSILGAVAGPIAGLFKKKEKPVENRINYKQMVKDAEAAGFNPLTVLRNGASAGYTSQVQHPALSSGFGDVLATGLNAWANYDPMSEKRADLEYQVVQEQLKQLQQKDTRERRSFDAPNYSGTSTRVSSGGFTNSVPVARTNPGGQLTVTDPWSGSVFQDYLSVHPGLPDAETGSTRYGEIVEMLGGIGILGGDLAYSGYQLANRKGNVDKAVDEGKKAWRDATAGYRDAVDKYGAGTAWASGLIPKRDRPYYPDMQDFNRGRGPY